MEVGQTGMRDGGNEYEVWVCLRFDLNFTSVYKFEDENNVHEKVMKMIHIISSFIVKFYFIIPN